MEDIDSGSENHNRIPVLLFAENQLPGFPNNTRPIDFSTRIDRVTVPALENILGDTLPILDHGHIRVVDYMGDESAIVQAARVSYGKGTKAVSQDRGLIRYLISHQHGTPLEMAELKAHMKLPIFVARQVIRTRTASVNEYSARYSEMSDEKYFPELDQIATQSTDNKQGRGATLSPERAQEVLDILKRDAEQTHGSYMDLIDPDKDYHLARELARIDLTLNTYTEWYWKIDVRNLMNFIALRIDPHAQYEVRVYAQAFFAILKVWMPNVAEALEDFVIEAETFSKQMLIALRKQLAGEEVTKESSGLTKREWDRYQSILNK